MLWAEQRNQNKRENGEPILNGSVALFCGEVVCLLRTEKNHKLRTC
jgi:hypothetical protein